MGRGSGVRAASSKSIEISFEYEGQQCRERIRREPTEANLKWVRNLKGQIANEISAGTFDYYRHFPRSKRVHKHTTNPAQAVTVGEVLHGYLESTRKSIEPHTFDDYNEFIDNTWRPRFGTWRLCDLTHAAVMDWVQMQESSRKRILNVLTPLRQAMRWAVGKQLLKNDPLGKIHVKRPVEIAEETVDPFGKAEIAAALEHLEPQCAHMIQFWTWTGLREGELIALRWSDIDLEKGIASIRIAASADRRKATKTKRGKREVKLLPGALEALARQKMYTRMLHAEVFMNPKGRKPWSRDKQIRVRWRQACMLAGIRYRSPDNLRHTYASWLLSAGEEVAWISAQMGHEHVGTTLKHYARYMPNSHPNAGMKAVAMFGEARLKDYPKSADESPKC